MSLILRWFGITNFVVILFVAAVAALGWSVRSALADDTEIVLSDCGAGSDWDTYVCTRELKNTGSEVTVERVMVRLNDDSLEHATRWNGIGADVATISGMVLDDIDSPPTSTTEPSDETVAEALEEMIWAGNGPNVVEWTDERPGDVVLDAEGNEVEWSENHVGPTVEDIEADTGITDSIAWSEIAKFGDGRAVEITDDGEVNDWVIDPEANVVYEDDTVAVTDGAVHMLQKHEAKDLDWFLIWPTLGVFILAITYVLWDMYRRWKRLE